MLVMDSAVPTYLYNEYDSNIQYKMAIPFANGVLMVVNRDNPLSEGLNAVGSVILGLADREVHSVDVLVASGMTFNQPQSIYHLPSINKEIVVCKLYPVIILLLVVM